MGANGMRSSVLSCVASALLLGLSGGALAHSSSTASNAPVAITKIKVGKDRSVARQLATRTVAAGSSPRIQLATFSASTRDLSDSCGLVLCRDEQSVFLALGEVRHHDTSTDPATRRRR